MLETQSTSTSTSSRSKRDETDSNVQWKLDKRCRHQWHLINHKLAIHNNQNEMPRTSSNFAERNPNGIDSSGAPSIISMLTVFLDQAVSLNVLAVNMCERLRQQRKEANENRTEKEKNVEYFNYWNIMTACIYLQTSGTQSNENKRRLSALNDTLVFVDHRKCLLPTQWHAFLLRKFQNRSNRQPFDRYPKPKWNSHRCETLSLHVQI